MKDLSYMDCWHFIAPLIPVVDEDVDEGLSQRIYVMVFHALNEAEKQDKEKANDSNKQGCNKKKH